MAENKIVGYKNIFGFELPDWVDEETIRLLVTFLLSSTAMLFVLIFVIWPRFTVVSGLKASLATEEKSLTSLSESKSGFDKLNEQIPESTQNLVLSAIPLTYSPENAIFLLRKVSEEVPGLSIVSYNLPAGVLYDASASKVNNTSGRTKDPVSFISYPIKLTVNAPVSSMLDFINKIETSLPLGVVSDLGMQEVSKLVSSTTTKSVQMDLEVTYYQAILNQVDITAIKPISGDDLALVKKISGFTSTTNDTGSNVSPVSVGSTAGLFGF